MATKLAAARIAQGAGCATLITLGRRDGLARCSAVEQGARATLFEPHATPAAAYKQWIAGSLAPQGALTVDAGAAAALRAGKSLLPAGVRGVARAASTRATRWWSATKPAAKWPGGLRPTAQTRPVRSRAAAPTRSRPCLATRARPA